MKNDIETRRANYFKLNTYLSQLDANQLRGLFEKNQGRQGWGMNHVIRVGGKKVFVKRLPVTDLEYENMYSTKNFYRLPTYYNYGVGSAGFGVFREIVALIKTTNAVLEGVVENFPLLYHHRVVPYLGDRPKLDMERHKGYVRYWNNNNQVGQYRVDRTQAQYEVMMFFEHIPHTLGPWFGKHMDQVDMVIGGMRDAISYLIKNDVIHFDCHWGNILTDGEQVYLADFGLVLEKRFGLNKREQDFFRANKYYDGGEFLCGLGSYVARVFRSLSDRKRKSLGRAYGLAGDMSHHQRLQFFLKNIEQIYSDGFLPLHERYVDQVIKYREIALMMDDFFFGMGTNNRKNTKYDHGKLRRLLKATGFVG